MTDLTFSAEQHRDMSNAIAALSMDAVQRANSGHPGMPLFSGMTIVLRLMVPYRFPARRIKSVASNLQIGTRLRLTAMTERPWPPL